MDMTEETIMCYVAADPEHPGTAWAIAVDAPEYKKYTAREIARWVKEGAEVKRLPYQEGLRWVQKWDQMRGVD